MNRSSQLPLSILVPTYNYGRFIGDALRSILGQGFEDYELIVIDNCSTDNTAEVVRGFDDSRLRYIINKENLGPYYSFLAFLDIAQGKYLRSLCADDVLFPEVLREQVAAMERYPSLGLVTCDMICTDEQLTNGVHVPLYPGYAAGELVSRRCLQELDNRIGGPSNYMYRRSAITSAQVDTSYSYIGDLKFAINLLRGKDYLNIGGPGYYYRRHGNTSTATSCPPALQYSEWFRLANEFGALNHRNAYRLLRSPMNASENKQLGAWLVKNLFRPKSIRSGVKTIAREWMR